MELLVAANAALICANLACLAAVTWAQLWRRPRCYDQSLAALADEQGDWFVNLVLERTLAKLFRKYADDAISDSDSETDSDGESESESETESESESETGSETETESESESESESDKDDKVTDIHPTIYQKVASTPGVVDAGVDDASVDDASDVDHMASLLKQWLADHATTNSKKSTPTSNDVRYSLISKMMRTAARDMSAAQETWANPPQASMTSPAESAAAPTSDS